MKSKEVLLNDGVRKLIEIVGLPAKVEWLADCNAKVSFYDAIEGKVFLFSKDVSVYNGWDHAVLSGSEYNPKPLAEIFEKEIKNI